MPEYPARKPNRLPGFDYAQNGAYFVTVCTKGKEPFLWVANPPACETYPVGATIGRPAEKFYEFAGTIGAMEPVPPRAGTARPYEIIGHPAAPGRFP